MSTWVILGCGYVGSRLARSLLADGHHVIACTRNRDTLAALEPLGAELHPFEAKRSKAFRHALGHERRATVVYALPPLPGLPPGDVVGRALAAAMRMGAERFVFLSSTAIYGEGRDGQVVDEDTPPNLDDMEARVYLSAEGPLEDARANGLDTVLLRLSAVYGPGRGVRERLRDGSYKLVDEGRHVFSRIHVDDVVGVIRAVVERAPANATYCLADDHPCPQREYAEWLSAHLGLRPPTSVPALAQGQPRHRIRNRAVSNARLKSELGYELRYPSYVEGEHAIDAELGESKGEGQGQAATAAAETPALVIHKRDAAKGAAGAAPEGSRLRRLNARHETVAPKASVHIGAQAETMVCVLAGAVELTRDEERHALAAGDMVEVPPGGLRFETTGAEPARLLVFGIRY
ncbi:NAD-dependent epimerase/dehydratase family protein [Haliangium sp.]|uniref:NAD-dependent epimerase/dehydratase family protein n=1 Tax=Haliangium sp. TaxID=2663208 RepID=UPI003D147795